VKAEMTVRERGGDFFMIAGPGGRSLTLALGPSDFTGKLGDDPKV
jgi:hypothetical protein